QFIYKGLEVFAHRRICAFIDAESGGSMLEKNLQKSDLDFSDFRNCLLHLIRNQVIALWITRETKVFLEEKTHSVKIKKKPEGFSFIFFQNTNSAHHIHSSFPARSWSR